MGNDGGVIAVKRKFMRHANVRQKNEQINEETLRQEKVTTCAISQEPLRHPIVACELGNLYNKEIILEQLHTKSIPEAFQHIKSLKDVVTCQFINEDKKILPCDYHCPVTMLAFHSKHPFLLSWSCGCILAERAIQEIQTKECLVCNKPMKEIKMIRLLQSSEEYNLNRKQLLERKILEKQQKDERKVLKKRKKTQDKDIETQEIDEKEGKSKKMKRNIKKQQKNDVVPTTSSIAKEAAQVLAIGKNKSKVYASLFNKDPNEKKNANDLLMTIGGMRYTLS